MTELRIKGQEASDVVEVELRKNGAVIELILNGAIALSIVPYVGTDDDRVGIDLNPLFYDALDENVRDKFDFGGGRCADYPGAVHVY